MFLQENKLNDQGMVYKENPGLTRTMNNRLMEKFKDESLEGGYDYFLTLTPLSGTDHQGNKSCFAYTTQDLIQQWAKYSGRISKNIDGCLQSITDMLTVKYFVSWLVIDKPKGKYLMYRGSFSSH